MRERLDDRAKCGGKGLEETHISGGKKNEMEEAWVAVIFSFIGLRMIPSSSTQNTNPKGEVLE